MRLTFEEIKKITFGAVRTWQEEDGSAAFSRCTEGQEATWYREKAILGERARSTTGVRLDFYTDSATLTFLARHGRKYDLLVDGNLFARVREGEKKTPHTFLLPAGNKRVTLVLPSHSRGAIAYFDLDDGAAVTPYTYRKKVLFVGDSITQGWNSEDDTASFAWRTALALDADFVNTAVGGAYFCPDAIEPIPAFAPQLVLVALGTNDFGHFKSAEAYVAAANETLARLARLYPDSTRVALTPIWRADLEAPRAVGTFADCRAVVARAARENGFDVIEGDALFPHDTALFADGFLHPNDAGFAVYAERLLAALAARGIR